MQMRLRALHPSARGLLAGALTAAFAWMIPVGTFAQDLSKYPDPAQDPRGFLQAYMTDCTKHPKEGNPYAAAQRAVCTCVAGAYVGLAPVQQGVGRGPLGVILNDGYFTAMRLKAVINCNNVPVSRAAIRPK
jgi:hypothetical protein